MTVTIKIDIGTTGSPTPEIQQLLQAVDQCVRAGLAVTKAAPGRKKAARTTAKKLALQGFETFFAAYPGVRKNRQRAAAAWRKQDCARHALAIMQRLQHDKAHHPDWTRDEQTFIQAPAVWINSRPWEDPYDTSTVRQRTDDDVISARYRSTRSGDVIATTGRSVPPTEK